MPTYNRSPPDEGTFIERPFLKGTLRALNLVDGVLAALIAFVFVGAYTALLTCEGTETHGPCVAHAGLVPVLEWPIFVISVLAPLAGGIAAFARRRPGRLGIGVAVAFAMFGLMSVVSTGQTPFNWG